MKLRCFVPFLLACIANSAIGSTTAESVLGECVDQTLVLGAACKAKPRHSNFLKLLENINDKDTALIVLEVTIRDVDPNVRKRYRFDLVKTDLGQTLLTLKSQMDFLTINLPLLSDSVDRQLMELIPSPPGCLTNITITDVLVKNWLLCGLTTDQDGIEKLLVKKVCFAKPYVEPNDWFLFRDTYYDECTDKSIKDSDWVRLNEDPLILLCKGILNYGVTIITALCVIVIIVYRRLHETKTRLFLFKLQNPETKTCEVVKRSSPEPYQVQLSPNKMNFPALKCTRCNFDCNGCRKRASNQWQKIDTINKTYELNITGFWFDIERDALISYNSFGLVSFLQASVEEMYEMVHKWCKTRCCCCGCLFQVLFSLIFIVGVLVPVFLFHRFDPFHSLLDGIVSPFIFILVPVSMILTKATLSVCRNGIDYSIPLIILEGTFFFLAFLVVAILTRVIVIICVGLAFNSETDFYTLFSSTAVFVLLNGYFELNKTYKRYHAFLKICMKHIRELVDETDTLNKPVFKNRIVPSDPGHESWPKNTDRKLSLLFKGFLLFYLPNGESAIKRDFFLDLCRNDTGHSPGDLRWNFVIGILKFIFWGIVVSGILIAQHIVSKDFDSSLYSQAPATVLGGLVPIFFDLVLFPERPKEENANLTRLLNSTKENIDKKYNVADFEMGSELKPSKYEDQQPDVWQSICIEKTRCPGCCCIQGDMSDENTTERTRLV